jgi:FtsZ-interacting cell division protein ZipA
MKEGSCSGDGAVLLIGILLVAAVVVIFAIPLVKSVDGLFDSRSNQLAAQADLNRARAEIERERGEAKAAVEQAKQEARIQIERERGEAQVAAEKAKQEREHQQSVDWIRELEIFAITMKMFSNDKTTELAIAAGIIGAMGALLIVAGIEIFLRLKT